MDLWGRWPDTVPMSQEATRKDATVYTDVLMREHAEGSDADVMDDVDRFDYRAQLWVKGTDHAHMQGATAQEADVAPLLFCRVLWADCAENV